MNTEIRAAIQNYLATNGPIESRALILLLATQFNTTKQRISGNISYMVCRDVSISLHRNYPHSVLF